VRIARKRVFVSIPYRDKTVIYDKSFWPGMVKNSQEDGGWDILEINKDCDYHIFEFSTDDFIKLVSYTDFYCKRNFPINYFTPLGRSKANQGTYFNFFDLELKNKR
jgi:hypothetical protein